MQPKHFPPGAPPGEGENWELFHTRPFKISHLPLTSVPFSSIGVQNFYSRAPLEFHNHQHARDPAPPMLPTIRSIEPKARRNFNSHLFHTSIPPTMSYSTFASEDAITESEIIGATHLTHPSNTESTNPPPKNACTTPSPSPLSSYSNLTTSQKSQP